MEMADSREGFMPCGEPKDRSMQHDPKVVAAGLTREQIGALLAAGECKGGKWWTPYQVRDVALARVGALTPLGLAVRAILKEQSNVER